METPTNPEPPETRTPTVRFGSVRFVRLSVSVQLVPVLVQVPPVPVPYGERKASARNVTPTHNGFFSRHVFLRKQSPCLERYAETLWLCFETGFSQKTKAPVRNATPRHHGFVSRHVFLRKQKPLLGTLRRDTMTFFFKTRFSQKRKAPARNATSRHNGFFNTNGHNLTLTAPF